MVSAVDVFVQDLFHNLEVVIVADNARSHAGCRGQPAMSSEEGSSSDTKLDYLKSQRLDTPVSSRWDSYGSFVSESSQLPALPTRRKSDNSPRKPPLRALSDEKMRMAAPLKRLPYSSNFRAEVPGYGLRRHRSTEDVIDEALRFVVLEPRPRARSFPPDRPVRRPSLQELPSPRTPTRSFHSNPEVLRQKCKAALDISF